jgi:hypothetical protein
LIPTSLTPSLEAAADAEILQVLTTGATVAGQAKPTGEVGFVAAFVLGAVPEIARAWRPLLAPHGLSVRMTGVFCHQAPQASFTDSAGASQVRELADLLVVADDLTTGALSERRAVLVQAKIASTGGGKHLSGKGDLAQLDLLSHWPPFTLPAGFAPGPRDFSTCRHQGSLVDAGRYGLIERAVADWRQQAPAVSMPAGGDRLGTFIARMVEGRQGYGREATGTADDWSRTVDELLKVTGGLSFTYSAGLKGSHPRGNSHLALVIARDRAEGYVSGHWASGEPPSGGRAEPSLDPPPSEGINLLHIGITHRG